MWKVVLLVLAVFILGHLAIRYVRKNPLDPEIVDSQVVVESQDFKVHFRRSGNVEGTYFVAKAESEDWTPRPVNATLHVFGMQDGTEYARSFADFHVLGSESSARLDAIATPLSLVAANRETYNELAGLVDDHESRASSKGERLCLTLSGEALSIEAAESLEDGHDVTHTVTQTNTAPIVYVDKLDVGDCTEMLKGRR